MLRIAHISANRFNSEFASNHTFRIWQELAKASSTYRVFARSNERRFYACDEGALQIRLLPSYFRSQFEFYFSAFLGLYSLVRFKPDVVILQCPALAMPIAMLLKIICKSNLYVEFHGEHYFRRQGNGWRSSLRYHFFRLNTLLVLNHAKKIRCLSHYMRASVVSVYGQKFEDRCVVIGSRVDLSLFSNIKMSYGMNSDFLNLVTIGALSDTKNHQSLIANLLSIGVDFQLTIFGEGPERSTIEKFIQTHSIEEKVTLKGNCSHQVISSSLHNYDIYIHYSKTEALPRAILEAMAVGLPCIISNTGLYEGVFIDGENCSLISVNSVSDLAGALLEFSNPRNRKRIGENGKTMVRNYYDWNIVFNAYRNSLIECGS